ncbi:MAG: cold shock domain-containing protein [Candidatus Pacebacteria bacterium]|nr:cold shock domain-containing protein [Candidatus Paceibacterota bacterium]
MLQQLLPVCVLATALRAARIEDGATEEGTPPADVREWKVEDRVAIWNHPEFGQFRFSAPAYGIEVSTAQGPNMWAEIGIGRSEKPASVAIAMTATLAPDAKLLYCKAGNLTEIGIGAEIPKLDVPVQWKNVTPEPTEKNPTPQEVFAPHTRVKDMDNADLVVLKPNGMFIQLQVSVITRAGMFYLGVQEVFAGQIVRTNASVVRKLELKKQTINGAQVALVVPLFAGNAYPRADYLSVFPNMGPKVIKFAVAQNACTRLSKCTVAEWAPVSAELPVDLPVSHGWYVGNVRYYNLVTGCGKLQRADGQEVFIHFSNIAGGGSFPSLEPMKAVVFQCRESQNAGLKQAGIPDAINLHVI